VFLWLPVANIFGSVIGKIQEKMIALDIQQIGQNGDTFFSPADTAYLIFMIIGIIGYFTVPSVANYIVHAGGGNALLSKVTSVFSSSASNSVQRAGSTATTMIRDAYGSGAGLVRSGMAEAGAAAGYFKDKIKGGDA
jgi:hypothetical protein